MNSKILTMVTAFAVCFPTALSGRVSDYALFVLCENFIPLLLVIFRYNSSTGIYRSIALAVGGCEELWPFEVCSEK